MAEYLFIVLAGIAASAIAISIATFVAIKFNLLRFSSREIREDIVDAKHLDHIEMYFVSSSDEAHLTNIEFTTLRAFTENPVDLPSPNRITTIEDIGRAVKDTLLTPTVSFKRELHRA